MTTCSVTGCSNRHSAKGLCLKHYQAARVPKVGPVCSVEGCNRTDTKTGLCGLHYQRFLKYGDTSIVKIARRTTDGKCGRCGGTEFYSNHACKKCQLGKMKARTYGVYPADFQRMLQSQAGGCAICGRQDSGNSRSENLSIDHCHSTGQVRALLCEHCNRGLGCFLDNPNLMELAAQYIRKYAELSGKVIELEIAV